MIWAEFDGSRVLATPELRKTLDSQNSHAVCPGCKKAVLPKCGSIVTWHWAHRTKDCDSWSEPESEWHINWKKAFPRPWQEVSMGNHRADVVTPRGVIEFQNSFLSSDEIVERETFYGRMVWVILAKDWNLEQHLDWHYKEARKRIALPDYQSTTELYSTILTPGNREAEAKRWRLVSSLQQSNPCYRWLWPRKSWFAASKTLFLDFDGDYLDQVKKIYKGSSVYLSCKRISKALFVSRVSAVPTAA